tara:strand:- start:1408 stop:1683 length:276 start_codon:yes stop_codon:yes gene_type:complete
MSYYNTTNLTGSELSKAISVAKSQAEKIKTLFRLTQKELTPFDVLAFFSEQTPVTSIRRAMTNLTNDGYLVQTENTKVEKYGKINYKWKLA